MRRLIPARLCGVLLTMAPQAGADDEVQLRAAQEHLQQARAALKGAGGEYGGHRKSALEHVEHALARVRDAVDLAAKHDRKEERKLEHKAKELEQDEQRLQRKLDKVEKKQDKLAPEPAQ